MNRYNDKAIRAPKMHKGEAYFPNFASACRMAEIMGNGRVIEYGLGFAVQYRVSGPYYPNRPLT